MKKTIISLITGLFSLSVFGQEGISYIKISNVYEFIKPEITIQLPFVYKNNSSCWNLFSMPERGLYFDDEFIIDNIELPIANNLQLSTFFYLRRRDPLDSEVGGRGWAICGKLPNPNNSGHVTALVSASGGAYTSAGFVTLDKNDHAIDKLISYSEIETILGPTCLREFTVDKDTTICVYTIRCIKPKSAPAWSAVEAKSFLGQRTDTRYKISSEGKFVEIEKTIFHPRKYKYTQLKPINDYNIRDGNEKPLK